MYFFRQLPVFYIFVDNQGIRMNKYHLKYHQHTLCYIESKKLMIETDMNTMPLIEIPLRAINSLKECNEDEYKVFIDADLDIKDLGFSNTEDRRKFIVEISDTGGFNLKEKNNTLFRHFLGSVSFIFWIIFSLNFIYFILRTTDTWVLKSNLMAVQISNKIADFLGVIGSTIGLILVFILCIYASYKNWNRRIKSIVILEKTTT